MKLLLSEGVAPLFMREHGAPPYGAVIVIRDEGDVVCRTLQYGEPVFTESAGAVRVRVRPAVLGPALRELLMSREPLIDRLVLALQEGPLSDEDRQELDSLREEIEQLPVASIYEAKDLFREMDVIETVARAGSLERVALKRIEEIEEMSDDALVIGGVSEAEYALCSRCEDEILRAISTGNLDRRHLTVAQLLVDRSREDFGYLMADLADEAFRLLDAERADRCAWQPIESVNLSQAEQAHVVIEFTSGCLGFGRVIDGMVVLYNKESDRYDEEVLSGYIRKILVVPKP